MEKWDLRWWIVKQGTGEEVAETMSQGEPSADKESGRTVLERKVWGSHNIFFKWECGQENWWRQNRSHNREENWSIVWEELLVWRVTIIGTKLTIKVAGLCTCNRTTEFLLCMECFRGRDGGGAVGCAGGMHDGCGQEDRTGKSFVLGLVFPGERVDAHAKGTDEILFGMLYKISCFVC